MAKGQASRELPLARIRKLPSIFPFLVPILFITACASPGEPVTRRPPVPTPIDDLAAEQSGNAVVLTFALPRNTVERKPLAHPPTLEIYRSFSQAAAHTTPPEPMPTLLVTIPSDLVGHYAVGGRTTYSDPLTPEILKDHAGDTATYIVRTSVSRKRSSADSNVAGIRIQPAPESIADLHAEVIHSAVNLTWTAPDKTPVGPAPPIREYGIFRAELPASTSAGQQPSSNALPAAPAAQAANAVGRSTPRLERVAQSTSPAYTDSQVALGRTYEYAVRSVVDYSGQEVESGDSNQVIVTVRSSVPPSAPQGLVVILVPATPETPAHLDLSWAINPETDIAGYNVYRSEEQGVLGTRLNSGLLPTPTFSDMSAVTAQGYFYSVTAVDRSGNESAPSSAVSAEVPAENQP